MTLYVYVCTDYFIWLFMYYTVNDDQQDATILAYLFIPNQLYMFRAVFTHHQEHLTVFTASDIVHSNDRFYNY